MPASAAEDGVRNPPWPKSGSVAVSWPEAVDWPSSATAPVAVPATLAASLLPVTVTVTAWLVLPPRPSSMLTV